MKTGNLLVFAINFNSNGKVIKIWNYDAKISSFTLLNLAITSNWKEIIEFQNKAQDLLFKSSPVSEICDFLIWHLIEYMDVEQPS